MVRVLSTPVLRAAFNPAGGVRYHLRARRHRDGAWAPFRAAIDAWIASWRPGRRTLALVGPSGGHCLPGGLVGRFEHLICFEPDPTARPIFASRVRTLAREAGVTEPRVTWLAEDAWVGPVLDGRGVPVELLEAQGCALLFTNFLGQASFLVPGDRWMAFRGAWRASLWPLLERVPWASFHDRVSGTIVPHVGDGLSTTHPLDDDAIVALYGDDQDGEVLDHRAGDLLPRGSSYAYFDWPIVPGRHHLVEGVLGPIVR